MRKKNSSAKPLFSMNTEKEEPKKKRGRPKKETVDIGDKQKQRKKPDTKSKKETVTKTDEHIVKEKPWKDFNKTKPECLVPVEFYVNTGKEKKDIFTGYIRIPGETITDEPYKLVVLRKKYGNLNYREIDGCPDLSKCPNGFPHCKECPIAKKRKK